MLRRWDYQAGDPKKGGSEISEGAVVIREGESDRRWMFLEDGIHVQFQPSKTDSENHYRTGDYWLLPARTATADIDWPNNNHNPQALEPHGIRHHYAPLAIVDFDESGNLCTQINCLPYI